MPYDPNIGKGMSEEEYLLGLPDDIKKVVCKRKPVHINEWCCRDTTVLVCKEIKVKEPVASNKEDTPLWVPLLIISVLLIIIWDYITEK